MMKVKQVASRFPDKFTQAEFLGPCEYSESACAPGGKRVGEISLIHHHFDFAILTKLSPEKANELHQRFFEIIENVVKSVAECEEVDSIRIADDFCDYRGPIYHPEFLEKTILPRQIGLAKIIKRRGKYAVLHADGDITPCLKVLSAYYGAFHPLDLRPKPTVTDVKIWADDVGRLRQSFPNNVLITGIPVDLLCNREVSPMELIDVVKYFTSKVGRKKLILANTHRPYPGWSLQDFIEKAWAIKGFIEAYKR